MPMIATSWGSGAQFEGGYEGFFKTGMVFGATGSGMLGEMALYTGADVATRGTQTMTGRGIASLSNKFLPAAVTQAGGKFFGSATVKAVGAGISTFFGAQIANTGGYMGGVALDALGQYGQAQKQKRIQKTYMGNLEMWGQGFRDTRGSQTMRQTALAMIQQSQLGVRSALGREAYHMHR